MTELEHKQADQFLEAIRTLPPDACIYTEFCALADWLSERPDGTVLHYVLYHLFLDKGVVTALGWSWLAFRERFPKELGFVGIALVDLGRVLLGLPRYGGVSDNEILARLTLQQLVQCSRADLMRISGFGPARRDRLVEVLGKLGLQLRGDPPPGG